MRGEAVAAGVCVCCRLRLPPAVQAKKDAKPLVKHNSQTKHHGGRVQARVDNECLGVKGVRTPLLRSKSGLVAEDALGLTTFLCLQKRYVAAIIIHRLLLSRGLKLTLLGHNLYCLDDLGLCPAQQLSHLVLDLVVCNVESRAGKVGNKDLRGVRKHPSRKS